MGGIIVRDASPTAESTPAATAADNTGQTQEDLSKVSVETKIQDDMAIEDKLSESKRRIDEGVGTLEDQALVNGFEAGAKAVADDITPPAEAPTAAPETVKPTVIDNPTEPAVVEDLTPKVIMEDPEGLTIRRIDTLNDKINQLNDADESKNMFEVDKDASTDEDLKAKLQQELQSETEFKEYLDGRDYKDKNENIHDAETGKFKSLENANSHDTYPEDADGDQRFVGMSMDQLLTEWAKAEDEGDRTLSMDVQDVIQEKLLQENKYDADRTLVTKDPQGTIKIRYGAGEKDGMVINGTDENGMKRANGDVIDGMSEDRKMAMIDVAYNEMMKRRQNSGEKPTGVDEPQPGDADKDPNAPITPEDEMQGPPELQGPPRPPEIAPDDKDPKPEDDGKDELSFTAGITKGALQELVHKAMEVVDKDQREKANLFGKNGNIKRLGLFKALKEFAIGSFKYNALVKANIIQNRSVELYKNIQEKMKASGKDHLTIEEFKKSIEGEGITWTSDYETAYLTSIQDDLMSKAEGVAFHGNGENDTEKMAGLRKNVKETILAYVGLAGAEGVTDEFRAGLQKSYQDKINIIAEEYMKQDDNFTKEQLTVYMDSSRELLERSLAISRHDDGMDRVAKALDSMKIDIGQRQVGAYNNISTKNIEKYIEVGKNHNAGSIIAKSSFVAASWVALSVGASIAVNSLVTSGAQAATGAGGKAATIGAGAILGGPVGLAIGIVGSGIVPALWGRYMGRRRQSENADLAATSAAYAGELAENPNMTALSPDTVKMSDATAELRGYMQLRPGVDPATAKVEDWQIRPDLTNDEKIKAVTQMSVFQAKLNLESERDALAKKALAEEESKGLSGTIKGLMRSQGDPNARSLNFFQAENSETYVGEHNQFMVSLRALAQGFSDTYADAEVELPSKTPEGEDTTEKATVAEYMAAQATEQVITAEAAFDSYQEKVQKSIDKAGHTGAKFGFIFGAGLNVAASGIRELVSGGGAHTIFDAVGVNQPGSSTASNLLPAPGRHLDVNGTKVTVGNNIGQSAITDNGHGSMTFTSPTGAKLTEQLHNGSLDLKSIQNLKAAGIDVTQSTGPDKIIHAPVNKFADMIGARPNHITDQLVNGTPGTPDGTELGMQIHKTGSGFAFIQDPGIAKGSSGAYNLINEARNGNMYLSLDMENGSVKVPMHVDGSGHITANIPHGSPLEKLLDQNGRPLTKTLHVGIGDPKGNSGMAVSAIRGENQGVFETIVKGAKKIFVHNVAPKIPVPATVPMEVYSGLVPGPTQTIGSERKETQEPAKPAGEQPIIMIDPNVDPTTGQAKPYEKETAEVRRGAEEEIGIQNPDQPEPDVNAVPEQPQPTDVPIAETPAADTLNSSAETITQPTTGRKLNVTHVGDYIVELPDNSVKIYPKAQMEQMLADGKFNLTT